MAANGLQAAVEPTRRRAERASERAPDMTRLPIDRVLVIGIAVAVVAPPLLTLVLARLPCGERARVRVPVSRYRRLAWPARRARPRARRRRAVLGARRLFLPSSGRQPQPRQPERRGLPGHLLRDCRRGRRRRGPASPLDDRGARALAHPRRRRMPNSSGCIGSRPRQRGRRSGSPRHSSRSRRCATRTAIRRELLQNVSHELRTPLASILTGATVLLARKRPPGARARRPLPASSRSPAGSIGWSGDMLDLARIEGHALELRLEPTDVGAAAEAAAQRLRTTDRTGPSGARRDRAWIARGRRRLGSARSGARQPARQRRPLCAGRDPDRDPRGARGSRHDRDPGDRPRPRRPGGHAGPDLRAVRSRRAVGFRGNRPWTLRSSAGSSRRTPGASGSTIPERAAVPSSPSRSRRRRRSRPTPSQRPATRWPQRRPQASVGWRPRAGSGARGRRRR